MLESLRRQGASVAVYIIFGILIAVFVINFRPGHQDGGGGCKGTSGSAISVDGKDASLTAYKIAYSNGTNRGVNKQRVHIALDELVARELLASEAADHGLRVSSDLVDDEIKRGMFYLGGRRYDLRTSIFDDVAGERFFNFKYFQRWVGGLNVSVNAYKDAQQRELQAFLMAEVLSGAIEVSRDEALSAYLYENNTVSFDAVTFRARDYRDAMRLTDADVSRFLAGHSAEVKARYDADERTYKGVKPQLKLRQLFIAKAEAPKPATPADDKKPAPADDKKPAPAATADDKKAKKAPAGLPIEEAKAKLAAAKVAITAGKQTFPDTVRALSTDEAAKANGGELGWRPVDAAALGDPALNEAAKALAPGQLSAVIATDAGVYLLQAVAKREGDLSFDQVKQEIASDLAKDTWSKEKARQEAIKALAAATAGTKPLEQLYERELVPRDQLDPGEILNNPDIPEETKEQFREQLRQRLQQHGSRETTTRDVPAGWSADPNGAGSSAPAAGSAAPAAGSAAPAAGSAAPAAGSGAGSATPAAEAPVAPAATSPAATDVMTPSKDLLPEFGPVAKPHSTRLGPSPRTNKLFGTDDNKDLAAALFDELTPGKFAARIYEADGGYVIVQSVARSTPKAEDFDKDADARLASLRDRRSAEFVTTWLKDRCEELAKAGKIKPAAELVRETDDKGNPLPSTYQPCATFR